MIDVTDRMTNALDLADRCWAKAVAKSPEFVENYLAVAEQLLQEKHLVRGDEFRERCKLAGIFRPPELHHNVWVSGVRTLQLIGWITENSKVVPTSMHNHMNVVTLWRSNLYNKFEVNHG